MVAVVVANDDIDDGEGGEGEEEEKEKERRGGHGIYDQGSANEAFFTLTEERSVK